MGSRFRPVIRVFVSSTFSDLKEERNALQREVFPRLEHYCLVRGFQFQAIDLRWGVPGEAGRDHRTMQICFDELRRAQEVSPRPNFLVLLGDRYGWQPLPESLTNEEFTRLEAAAARVDQREPDRGLAAAGALRAWYRRDDNADPVEYVLRSRFDWPDRGVWEDESAEKRAWEIVEQALWDVINEAYRLDSLAGRFASAGQTGSPPPAIVKFQGSATEQEIWRGALAVPDAPEHVVAWYRTIRNREKWQHDKRTEDFFDSNEALHGPAAELWDELRQRLHRDGRSDVQPAEVDLQESTDRSRLEVTRDHLQPMCDEIEARLREIVDEEIRAYWRPPGSSSAALPPNQSGPSEARKLELEAEAHTLFGESRAPKFGFVGRDAELKAMAEYLRDENDREPLVVHGPSGTGKTAILARAAQIAAEEYKGCVFLRFLGTTPQSSNLNALLTSVCRELRPSEDRANDLPVELRLLLEEFDRLLALATEEKPILLFLDALDQLDEADGARQAYWLRTPLPPHVKAVVSCIKDEEGPAELNEAYRCFDRRKLLHRAIAVESLTSSDAMSAIDLWLRHDDRRQGRRRQLTNDQLDSIASRITPDSAAARRRPLYLRILFEECRLWPSWKAVSADELGGDTAALLEGLFDRLAQPAVHGALLVESALSYIASARRGLSESEILEVLWADPDYRQHLDAASQKTKHELPPEATSIPIAIWSRLRHDLDPYLAEHSSSGGVVLNFYHRVVGCVVAERFLKDAARRCLRHSRLEKYFQSEQQPWWREPDASRQRTEATAIRRVPNARRATELPWQLLHEADETDHNHAKPDAWDAPVNLLCDLEFVEVKCAAGLVFELQEDYRNTIAGMPESQEGLRQKREGKARLDRWTEEITAYSRQWSERRKRLLRGDLVNEPEPQLPDPPPSCRMWTEEEIEADRKRIIENPTRLGRMQALSAFVEQECYPLLEFGSHSGFAVQHAFNYAPRGPLHEAASLALPFVASPLLMRQWFAKDEYNPRPAILRTLEGHTDGVAIVSVTPDGKRAVSCSYDKSIRVWDLATGLCLRTLVGHTFVVNGVSVTPDGRLGVSGSNDRTVRVWDLERGTCLRTLEGHTYVVNSVSVTPDGQLAVSASGDKTLRVWDLATGSCLRVLEGHTGQATSVCVVPDGRRAVSASVDKTLRVWNLETGKCLRILRGHSGEVYGLSVTPDGRQLVSSASGDKTVRVWDLESGTCLQIMEGHTDAVWRVSLTPDGRYAVSASSDYTIRAWDLKTGVCARTLRGHSSSVNSVSVTADGREVISGSSDNTLRIWNLETGASQYTLEGHTKAISGLSLMPNEMWAVSAGSDEDNTLRIWDLEKGDCLKTLVDHRNKVSSVCVTLDGKRAVSGSSGDDEPRIWDLETGRCVRTLKTRKWWSLPTARRGYVSVSHMCVTADGRRVVGTEWAVRRNGDLIRVWNLETGTLLRTIDSGSEVHCVTITPLGGRAVLGDHSATLKVWDLETGSCVRTLRGHTAQVFGVAATVSGRQVVSASYDNTLRLWDLATGTCLRVFEGHMGPVRAVTVTVDGRRVVSGSYDKTLRIWDLESGACLAIARLNAICRVVAVARGDRIVVGTSTGEILQFNLCGMSLTAVSQAS